MTIPIRAHATAGPPSCFCKGLSFPFQSLLHVAAGVNSFKMVEQCTPDHVDALQKVFLVDPLPSRKSFYP